jgi:[ribosomal protein S5]-alanine N-acetyltransferase
MRDMPDSTLKCTESILLRAPRLSDAESLARNANDRNVWINLRDRMPYPYRLEDALSWIERTIQQEPRTNFIIDVNGKTVGGIGLVLGSDIERCSAEVGYWLGAEYRNQGIATAALSRICQYAFEELRLLRIFATPITWNPSSFRVLEKVGFVREGLMRNASSKTAKLWTWRCTQKYTAFPSPTIDMLPGLKAGDSRRD